LPSEATTRPKFRLAQVVEGSVLASEQALLRVEGRSM
jgi:hypothetical protein